MSNILPVCYICECFLERNYFLSKYNAHVQYHGENYLTEDLKSVSGQLFKSNLANVGLLALG